LAAHRHVLTACHTSPLLTHPPPHRAVPSLDACTVMHVHFGMSGAFRTMTAPGQAPTETTRLRLEHEGAGIVAHLSAMTVAHGGLELYHAKVGGGDRGGGGHCGTPECHGGLDRHHSSPR